MRATPFFKFIFLFVYLLVIFGCAKKSTFEKPTLREVDGYTEYRSKAKYSELHSESAARRDDKYLDMEISKLQEKLQRYEDSEGALQLEKRSGTTKLSEIVRAKPPEISKPEKRMVFHEAEIKTRSTEPELLIDSAVNLVKTFNGYLESQHKNTIALRIPVEHFKTVFDSLLKIGEIIDYSQSSTDITEAFYDTEARIDIFEKTITRLREILTHTKKEEEQIKLLNQIKRLSEELEELITKKKVLSKKAQYSRIVFAVLQYTPSVYHTSIIEIGGFTWIRNLDQFKQERKRRASRFRLEIPDGMVQVKKPRLWFAQSAGGSKIWTAKIKNIPKGTSDFWVKAIKHRVSENFIGDTTYDIGSFKVLQLRPYPGDNYIYAIAVKTMKKRLYIVEIYYPDEEQYERFSGKVTAVLERKKM